VLLLLLLVLLLFPVLLMCVCARCQRIAFEILAHWETVDSQQSEQRQSIAPDSQRQRQQQRQQQQQHPTVTAATSATRQQHVAIVRVHGHAYEMCVCEIFCGSMAHDYLTSNCL